MVFIPYNLNIKLKTHFNSNEETLNFEILGPVGSTNKNKKFFVKISSSSYINILSSTSEVGTNR